MIQASEKAWEAVAHYVKSVAKAKGWPDESRWDIADNARRLLLLTSDPDGNRMRFAMIDVLHINFYDDDLDPKDVEIGVRDARTLIDAMREAEAKLGTRDDDTGGCR